jgi:hypothetical protein
MDTKYYSKSGITMDFALGHSTNVCLPIFRCSHLATEFENSTSTPVFSVGPTGTVTATGFIGPLTGAASANVLKAGFFVHRELTYGDQWAKKNWRISEATTGLMCGGNESPTIQVPHVRNQCP